MKRITKNILLCGTVFPALILTGCGGKNDTQRKLEDATKVKEVKNFSEYRETEIPTEPPTEKKTEPPTEKHTEPPTEKHTEPPTSAPAPAAYSRDYDFSDLAVLGAVFKNGGIGSVPYTSVASQDEENRIRTQTVTFEDGQKTVIFTADPYSGRTNGKVEIRYPVGSEAAVRDVLLSFDNGINEDNVDDFMAGAYNGTEKAPYLGLHDAMYVVTDRIYVTLEKNGTDEGPVPNWEERPADLGELTGSAKVSGELSSGADPFSDLVSSMEFGAVSFDGSEYTGREKRADEQGNVISEGAAFTARYSADNGNSYVFEAGLPDAKLKVTVTRSDCNDPVTVMYLADHIFRYFKSGPFDTGHDILSTDFETDGCRVSKTENGFIMYFF